MAGGVDAMQWVELQCSRWTCTGSGGIDTNQVDTHKQRVESRQIGWDLPKSGGDGGLRGRACDKSFQCVGPAVSHSINL